MSWTAIHAVRALKRVAEQQVDRLKADLHRAEAFLAKTTSDLEELENDQRNYEQRDFPKN